MLNIFSKSTSKSVSLPKAVLERLETHTSTSAFARELSQQRNELPTQDGPRGSLLRRQISALEDHARVLNSEEWNAAATRKANSDIKANAAIVKEAEAKLQAAQAHRLAANKKVADLEAKIAPRVEEQASWKRNVERRLAELRSLIDELAAGGDVDALTEKTQELHALQSSSRDPGPLPLIIAALERQLESARHAAAVADEAVSSALHACRVAAFELQAAEFDGMRLSLQTEWIKLWRLARDCDRNIPSFAVSAISNERSGVSGASPVPDLSVLAQDPYGVNLWSDDPAEDQRLQAEYEAVLAQRQAEREAERAAEESELTKRFGPNWRQVISEYHGQGHSRVRAA
ncbi:hypothetical protein [Methylibium rhizosphaerae]|uniref:hypothetical protein n=1 Tax=Methylibium rhizosphaerae TaxID=2570323 RepID=UPI00112C04F3|nr:hypothetical protein [Methylibium rhizosphaerae]